jgi:hypothetical protein
LAAVSTRIAGKTFYFPDFLPGIWDKSFWKSFIIAIDGDIVDHSSHTFVA